MEKQKNMKMLSLEFSKKNSIQIKIFSLFLRKKIREHISC